MQIESVTFHIVGLGAIGSHIVELLAANGAKKFILEDYDIVQESNLERTRMYTLQDVGTLKVIAAKTHLEQQYPDVQITASPTMFSGVTTADVLIDGTDSLESRLVLNDAARKQHIPLLIATASQDTAMAFVVVGTPCWQCIALAKRATDSCESGILRATLAELANKQLNLVLDLLKGTPCTTLEVLHGSWRSIVVHQHPQCAACQGTYTYLTKPFTFVWCEGKQQLHARPTQPTALDLSTLDAVQTYEQAVEVRIEEGSALVHKHGLVEFNHVSRAAAQAFLQSLMKKST